MIATFSRRIIYDYLRGELNFQGVIASDNLEMGTIKAICPIGEAGVSRRRPDTICCWCVVTSRPRKKCTITCSRPMMADKSFPRKELEESITNERT